MYQHPNITGDWVEKACGFPKFNVPRNTDEIKATELLSFGHSIRKASWVPIESRVRLWTDLIGRGTLTGISHRNFKFGHRKFHWLLNRGPKLSLTELISPTIASQDSWTCWAFHRQSGHGPHTSRAKLHPSLTPENLLHIVESSPIGDATIT